MVTEVEHEDDDKTPVLSRENSHVQSRPITPVWKRKAASESGGKLEIQASLSRGPSICSNSSRKNAASIDEGNNRRSTDWKLRREFGASPPCRRKIEGSPASVRRSVTLEGSPSSIRKSVTFDPDSPGSIRKSSTISTTPSLRSDSTLQISAPTDPPSIAPESPILMRRGSSMRAEISPIMTRKTNSVLDSGIHFASPLPPRRKEPEMGAVHSPCARRKDPENSSHSPVVRRKETLLSQSRRESFRGQLENNNEPGPSSNRDNVVRKFSFPEGKLWHAGDAIVCRRGIEIASPETKRIQMPVISSPILRTSSSHNRFLVRRASERVGNAETAVTKLLSRASPSKAELKQNSVSAANPDSVANKQSIGTLNGSGSRPASDNQSSRDADINLTLQTELKYPATTNEVKKTVLSNIGRPPAKHHEQHQTQCEEANSVAALPARTEMRPRQREGFGGCSARIRKKTRSILMESLEVNWSVDEIRSKFQNVSEPPPFLDTIYSGCSMK